MLDRLLGQPDAGATARPLRTILLGACAAFACLVVNFLA